jgi:hypothetical protein
MVGDSKFIVYIIIENIGPVSAYRISIKFDKEITSVKGDKKISSMKIFDRIEFLLPHKKKFVPFWTHLCHIYLENNR